MMLGVVVSVFGGFAFLVWNSYRMGARRLEAASAEPGSSGLDSTSERS